jgi:uncharacterized membrane-anchored protein YhcB (DUF1043 family)
MSEKVSAEDLKNIQKILGTVKDMPKIKSQDIIDTLKTISPNTVSPSVPSMATTELVTVDTSNVFTIMGYNIPRTYVYIGLLVLLVSIIGYMWYSGKQKEKEMEKHKEGTDKQQQLIDHNSVSSKTPDQIALMKEQVKQHREFVKQQIQMKEQKEQKEEPVELEEEDEKEDNKEENDE